MFYKSIAKVYDEIFPINPRQIDFINSIKQIRKDEFILDIGCATGNLTTLLSKYSGNVIGIDLDKELLEIAKEKNQKLQFVEQDMLSIKNEFKIGTVDRVISFGNTLVHLQDRNSVKKYFRSVYSILKTGGYFTVQIINYDRIINQKLNGLPTIENNIINFKREYILQKDKVDFKTKLTIRKSGEVINNCISLLMLTKNEIENYLQTTGFKTINFYGDLNGNKLTNESIHLIFNCIK